MYFVSPFVPVTRDARDARQLARLVDATLDRFFVDGTQPAPRTPALDVAESAHAYTVTLDVPGVARDDVHVTVEGRRVTVRTQRQAAAHAVPAEAALATHAPAAAPDAAQTNAPVADANGTDTTAPSAKAANAAATASERIVYRERAVPSYARSFTLPLEVDQAEAGARLENGVLTLTLPKRHVRAAAKVTVN